jgi:hypothetical protein
MRLAISVSKGLILIPEFEAHMTEVKKAVLTVKPLLSGHC